MRAMVRREDARAAALRAKGVDIAVADVTDMERVSVAMRGVQRAYWLPPYDPAMLTGALVFATAAGSPARSGNVAEAISIMTQHRARSWNSFMRWLVSLPWHMSSVVRQVFLNAAFCMNRPMKGDWYEKLRRIRIRWFSANGIVGPSCCCEGLPYWRVSTA